MTDTWADGNQIDHGDGTTSTAVEVKVQADGADATLGAKADAAVAAGASGSVSAKLRRLTTDLGALLGLFPSAATPGQGIAYGSLTKIMAALMIDNGATLDLAHGTKEITVLASAARTAQVNGSTLTNYSCRGVLLWLNVTVASGTGGLTVRPQSVDPVSAATLSLNTAPTAVTATGITTYLIYPGATTGAVGATQSTNAILPRSWRVVIGVGDSSSYTYSLGACLIP